MIEPVSVALKFAFLIVLYLFLLWVVRSAAKDLRRNPGMVAVGPPASEATAMHSAASGLTASAGDEPRLLVEHALGHESGIAYDLGAPVTLGRGDVELHLEDPFASSQHARITRQGPAVVLEDLGSTNGTFLNGEPISGPQPLHHGDRIRIGDSEFSFLSD